MVYEYSDSECIIVFLKLLIIVYVGYSVSKIAINQLTLLHAKLMQNDPRVGILVNCVSYNSSVLTVIIIMSLNYM